MKSKSTTFLLALFLGWAGAHRFYLGQTGRGLLYLIFSWTFIPLIISIIDFILFAIMSDDEFNKQYNHVNQFNSLPRAQPYNSDRDTDTPKTMSIAFEIEKLAELKEKGLLTIEEFEQRKSKLLES